MQSQAARAVTVIWGFTLTPGAACRPSDGPTYRHCRNIGLSATPISPPFSGPTAMRCCSSLHCSLHSLAWRRRTGTEIKAMVTWRLSQRSCRPFTDRAEQDRVACRRPLATGLSASTVNPPPLSLVLFTFVARCVGLSLFSTILMLTTLFNIRNSRKILRPRPNYLHKLNKQISTLKNESVTKNYCHVRIHTRTGWAKKVNPKCSTHNFVNIG